MHYNAGHSSTFGLSFDGDGADRLTVDPAPDRSLRTEVHNVCGDVEVAGDDGYYTKTIKRK